MVPSGTLFSEYHPVAVLLPHHFFVFVSKVDLEHLVSSSTRKPVRKFMKPIYAIDSQKPI